MMCEIVISDHCERFDRESTYEKSDYNVISYSLREPPEYDGRLLSEKISREDIYKFYGDPALDRWWGNDDVGIACFEKRNIWLYIYLLLISRGLHCKQPSLALLKYWRKALFGSEWVLLPIIEVPTPEEDDPLQRILECSEASHFVDSCAVKRMVYIINRLVEPEVGDTEKRCRDLPINIDGSPSIKKCAIVYHDDDNYPMHNILKINKKSLLTRVLFAFLEYFRYMDVNNMEVQLSILKGLTQNREVLLNYVLELLSHIPQDLSDVVIDKIAHKYARGGTYVEVISDICKLCLSADNWLALYMYPITIARLLYYLVQYNVNASTASHTEICLTNYYINKCKLEKDQDITFLLSKMDKKSLDTEYFKRHFRKGPSALFAAVVAIYNPFIRVLCRDYGTVSHMGYNEGRPYSPLGLMNTSYLDYTRLCYNNRTPVDSKATELGRVLLRSAANCDSSIELELGLIYGIFQWDKSASAELDIYVFRDSSWKNASILESVQQVSYVTYASDASKSPDNGSFEVDTVMAYGHYLAALNLSLATIQPPLLPSDPSKYYDRAMCSIVGRDSGERAAYPPVGLPASDSSSNDDICTNVVCGYTMRIKLVTIVKVLLDYYLKLLDVNIEHNLKFGIESRMVLIVLTLCQRFKWLSYYSMVRRFVSDIYSSDVKVLYEALRLMGYHENLGYWHLWEVIRGKASPPTRDSILSSKLEDIIPLLTANQYSELEVVDGKVIMCKSDSNTPPLRALQLYGIYVGYVCATIAVDKSLNSRDIICTIYNNETPLFHIDQKLTSLKWSESIDHYDAIKFSVIIKEYNDKLFNLLSQFIQEVELALKRRQYITRSSTARVNNLSQQPVKRLLSQSWKMYKDVGGRRSEQYALWSTVPYNILLFPLADVRGSGEAKGRKQGVSSSYITNSNQLTQLSTKLDTPTPSGEQTSCTNQAQPTSYTTKVKCQSTSNALDSAVLSSDLNIDSISLSLLTVIYIKFCGSCASERLWQHGQVRLRSKDLFGYLDSTDRIGLGLAKVFLKNQLYIEVDSDERKIFDDLVNHKLHFIIVNSSLLEHINKVKEGIKNKNQETCTLDTVSCVVKDNTIFVRHYDVVSRGTLSCRCIPSTLPRPVKELFSNAIHSYLPECNYKQLILRHFLNTSNCKSIIQFADNMYSDLLTTCPIPGSYPQVKQTRQEVGVRLALSQVLVWYIVWYLGESLSSVKYMKDLVSFNSYTVVVKGIQRICSVFPWVVTLQDCKLHTNISTSNIHNLSMSNPLISILHDLGSIVDDMMSYIVENDVSVKVSRYGESCGKEVSLRDKINSSIKAKDTGDISLVVGEMSYGVLGQISNLVESPSLTQTLYASFYHLLC